MFLLIVPVTLFSIPMEKHIPVESGCMDNDVSSSSESNDSDFET